MKVVGERRFPGLFSCPPLRPGKRTRACDRTAGKKRRLPRALPLTAPPARARPFPRARRRNTSPAPGEKATGAPPFRTLFRPCRRSPLPAHPLPDSLPSFPMRRSFRPEACPATFRARQVTAPGASSSRSRSFPEQERPLPHSPRPSASPAFTAENREAASRFFSSSVGSLPFPARGGRFPGSAGETSFRIRCRTTTPKRLHSSKDK